MKKIYPFAIFIMVMAVILSACAPPAAPAESGEMAGEMDEEVTINIITAQGPLADGLVALIPAFEEENPGIKVEVTPFPWTNFFEKVISLARTALFGWCVSAARHFGGIRAGCQLCALDVVGRSPLGIAGACPSRPRRRAVFVLRAEGFRRGTPQQLHESRADALNFTLPFDHGGGDLGGGLFCPGARLAASVLQALHAVGGPAEDPAHGAHGEEGDGQGDQAEEDQVDRDPDDGKVAPEFERHVLRADDFR